MKKLVTIMTFFVVVALSYVTVFAANSAKMTFSTSHSTVNRGDTVTITVSLSAVDNCRSAGFAHQFDTNVFEFVDGSCTLSGTSMGSVNGSAASFAYGTGTSVSGQIFTYRLKVKNTAAYGTYSVSGIANVRNTNGPISTSTSSASITIGCKHSYDNNCDTTCNDCGSTRNISHNWNSGSYSTKPTCTSSGTKVYTCKVCGTTKSETTSKANHTYDNGCDESCNVCGKTRTVSHTYEWALEGQGHIQKCKTCGISQNNSPHSLAAETASNEGGHGYKCTVCGLIPDLQAHNYESDCDATCDECGYTRTVTHAYNEKAVYDVHSHWFVCMICGGVTEKVAHEPDEKADESSDQMCLTCGYITQTASNHIHRKSGNWHSNDVGHWTYCACLAFFEPEAHILAEGVMDEEANTVSYECKVCKHIITEKIAEETFPEETTPPTTSPQNTNPDETSDQGIPLWFILACGLGVSFIVNIIFIICVSIKKRGHFSK